MKEFADKLSDADKTELNTNLEALKEAHKSADLDKIDSAMSQLTESWNKISTEMYKNASADASATDNVDYEEVK